MCIVAIIRNLLFTKDGKSTRNLIIIVILIILSSILTFDSYFCLFNIIATIIYTYALWQKNTKVYKLLGIIVNGLMIIYDVYIKTFFGAILITISFISSIVGYLMEIKNK